MANHLRLGPKLGATAVLLALSLTLGGCDAGDDSYYANTAYLSRSYVVPLIQTLPPSTSAEPLVLEFELPPPGWNASPLLIIALRVRAVVGQPEEIELRNAIDEARKHGLAAHVELQRLDLEGMTNVPLTRPQRMPDSSTQYVPLEKNGGVEHVWLADVDTLSLQSAGLSQSYQSHQQLALAQVQDPAPGKYRLTLQLLEPPARIAELSSELLIAYGFKAK